MYRVDSHAPLILIYLERCLHTALNTLQDSPNLHSSRLGNLSEKGVSMVEK